jgi:hypothetical protein
LWIDSRALAYSSREESEREEKRILAMWYLDVVDVVVVDVVVVLLVVVVVDVVVVDVEVLLLCYNFSFSPPSFWRIS